MFAPVVAPAPLTVLDQVDQVLEAEQLARAFAVAWPTPAVKKAIAYCETGRLGWVQVAALFARSYGYAVKAEAPVRVV